MMRAPRGRGGGGGFRDRGDGGRGGDKGGSGMKYRGGGRSGPGGGRGRGGMKSGNKVIVEPHRQDGVFVARGKEDALVPKNMVPGAVYNDQRISVQANCIDSNVPAEAVFQSEVKKLQQEQFKHLEQVTLDPFERDHACVVGGYRMPKKQKAAA